MPVNVFYFFNVTGGKCKDKTLTRGFGFLWDFFVILLYVDLVLSNQLIMVELPP